MNTDWGSGFTIDPARLLALPEQTVELSADVVAYDAGRAVAETRDRQDPLYWADLDVPAGWLLVGSTSTGDEWWTGPRGDVWFFDGAHGERAVDRFEPMHLSVTEWLMVGHLLGRVEASPTRSDADAARLAASLDAIAPELADRWPFPLPLD